MAKIVLVHGAFNELWGPNELKSRWLPAVRDGLWHHDVQIADDDLDVCFYGDLFRRAPGTDAGRRSSSSRAPASPSRCTRWAATRSPCSGRPPTTPRSTAPSTWSRSWPPIPTSGPRCAPASSRSSTTTRASLVAHSLGTVLSYMALANHPQWTVHTFVTLGSPLASPMVAGMLDPPLVDGKGQWPGSIQRWVNVRAVGDKAAAVPVAERFGDRVEDVLVDNGHRAHAPEPYLNSPPTGEPSPPRCGPESPWST